MTKSSQPQDAPFPHTLGDQQCQCIQGSSQSFFAEISSMNMGPPFPVYCRLAARSTSATVGMWSHTPIEIHLEFCWLTSPTHDLFVSLWRFHNTPGVIHQCQHFHGSWYVLWCQWHIMHVTLEIVGLHAVE